MNLKEARDEYCEALPGHVHGLGRLLGSRGMHGAEGGSWPAIHDRLHRWYRGVSAFWAEHGQPARRGGAAGGVVCGGSL